MFRGIWALTAGALIWFGVIVSVVRLHVDGLSALAFAGLVMIVLDVAWEARTDHA